MYAIRNHSMPINTGRASSQQRRPQGIEAVLDLGDGSLSPDASAPTDDH